MLEKIISGGQTGADQAAWRAAKAFGVPTGGWMPEGFLTEDGPHPEFAEQYGAAEMPADSDLAPTEQNVQDSDATLWFGETTTAGAQATVGACQQFGKPCMPVYPGRGVRAVARRNVDRGEPDQDVERGRQPRGRGARDRGAGGTVPRRGPATARSPTSLIRPAGDDSQKDPSTPFHSEYDPGKEDLRQVGLSSPMLETRRNGKRDRHPCRGSRDHVMKMITLVACGLILGALAGCELALPAADVPAASAQPGPRLRWRCPGRTRCMLARRGIIASAILRPVVEVLVGPGDRVTKGQVLIKLFDLEPQAKVRAREKELRSIEAKAQASRRNLDLAEKSQQTGAIPQTTYNEMRGTALSNECAGAQPLRPSFPSLRASSSCIP